MSYKEEKNQSIETDPEMSQMTELVDKDIKTAIRNIPYAQEGRGKQELVHERHGR